MVQWNLYITVTHGSKLSVYSRRGGSALEFFVVSGPMKEMAASQCVHSMQTEHLNTETIVETLTFYCLLLYRITGNFHEFRGLRATRKCFSRKFWVCNTHQHNTIILYTIKIWRFRVHDADGRRKARYYQAIVLYPQ